MQSILQRIVLVIIIHSHTLIRSVSIYNHFMTNKYIFVLYFTDYPTWGNGGWLDTTKFRYRKNKHSNYAYFDNPFFNY